MRLDILFIGCIYIFPGLIRAQEKLEIDGVLKIANTLNDAPPAGVIRFNPASSDFEGWNGYVWISLTGKEQAGSVPDVDGNVYATKIIAGREWMAENLRTSKYRNGQNIANLEPYLLWMNATSGAWCFFQNNNSNNIPLGKLYNFYAVVDNRGLCPTGWHIPANAEWEILANQLGGAEVAGGKMKIVGVDHWNTPNTDATNEGGFTAFPAAFRRTDGSFADPGITTIWWTSTLMDISNAIERNLDSDDGNISSDFAEFTRGYSVRCIKN